MSGHPPLIVYFDSHHTGREYTLDSMKNSAGENPLFARNRIVGRNTLASKLRAARKSLAITCRADVGRWEQTFNGHGSFSLFTFAPPRLFGRWQIADPGAGD